MIGTYLARGFNNTFVYACASLITRAISFIFLPYFLNKLSLYEFGVLDLYQNFFSLGTMLFTSCASISLMRFYFVYKDDVIKQRQAIGNGLLLALVGSLTLTIGMLIISLVHPTFLVRYSYGLLVGLNIGLFTLFSMVLVFARVQEQFIHYLVYYCGQNIIATLLTVIGVSYGYGIQAFFYSNLVSFIIFLPLFISLFVAYRSYSLSVLKEQLFFAAPLIIYTFCYSCFFTIDRFFITSYVGYEALGAYSLLWRFGALFQFVSIALMDAWFIVILNAQKEEQGDQLIGKLTTYMYMIIYTLLLGVICASYVAINWFVPEKYHFIKHYLPLFMSFVASLELIKLSQTGFSLACITFYIPFITATAMGLQTLLLYALCSFNLYGVLVANCGALCTYIFINYFLSQYIYSPLIVERKRVVSLTLLCLLFLLIAQGMIIVHMPWYYMPVYLLAWLVAVWFLIATDEDKQAGKEMLFKIVSIPDPAINNNILYIRTHIQHGELKAGGSVAHTMGVIQGFVRQGYNVMCATTDLIEYIKTCEPAGIQRLKVYPIFAFLRGGLYLLRWRLECLSSNVLFIFQLRKILFKSSFTYIYQRNSYLNCVGVIVRYLKKVPLILEYNGSEVWVFEMWGEKTVFKFTRLATWIEKLNLRYADYIVVVSQVLKDQLITKGIDAKKILVNPNGVNVEDFDPEKLVSSRDQIRSSLAIADKFVFGFIGTFSYFHGIEILSQIIPGIVKHNNNAHFLLIGQGVLKEQLEQDLAQHGIGKEHVTFTGLVPQQQAKHYLAACDAFLCPSQANTDGSRFFCSPIKIFEYLSMGKPVIASDLEQLSELIYPAIHIKNIQSLTIKDQVGMLVEPTDIQAFIKASVMLSTMKPSELSILGNQARQRAINNYSWDKHIQRIERFIDEHST